MFSSDQIISATLLIKDFRAVARRLKYEPQAVLIVQRNGEKLVLVNTQIFEDLVYRAHRLAGEEGSERP